ncbi:hypothetical protein [Chryseobacterium arthrosphaerae]|uniref:hypothetical protein n=1 Tax=Chryseobacterium arthrosphaerae TaxID=651561 RepID=UPI00241FAFD4|nr:hypothetical protein [Chryseobacterium arthrosphaerae]
MDLCVSEKYETQLEGLNPTQKITEENELKKLPVSKIMKQAFSSNNIHKKATANAVAKNQI